MPDNALALLLITLLVALAATVLLAASLLLPRRADKQSRSRAVRSWLGILVAGALLLVLLNYLFIWRDAPNLLALFGLAF
jgi:drug/metabolite transporter (DMT)-like permease